MKLKNTHKIIIVGSGPAGLTAGIYAARANLKPVIIEGTEPGGQLMGTTAVENWPGEESIMGPKLMINIRKHAEKTGCTFIAGDVISAELGQPPFKLVTSKQEELLSETIIIATGATPKRLGIPGEATYWGKGVTTCAVCDGAFYKDKPVVIVGGGDTAMEDASFMTNFTDKITIVQIEPHLTASVAMQQRVLDNPKINIIYNSSISKVIGDQNGVTEVIIKNKNTQETTPLAANAMFVAIGLRPNTKPFQGQLDTDELGYLVLHDGTRTSKMGIFGAGDVSDFRYRQAITSAGAGCMAALDAERYLKSVG